MISGPTDMCMYYVLLVLAPVQTNQTNNSRSGWNTSGLVPPRGSAGRDLWLAVTCGAFAFPAQKRTKQNQVI